MTTANIMNLSKGFSSVSVKGAAADSDPTKAAEEAAAMFGSLMNQFGRPDNWNAVPNKTPQTSSVSSEDVSSRDYRRASWSSRDASSVAEAKSVTVSDRVQKASSQVNETGKQIVEKVSEQLGVTEEEVEGALENLGLSAFDLLKPQNLGDVLLELTDAESLTQLLMGPDVQELLQGLGQMGQELLQSMELKPGQMDELIAQMDALDQEEPLAADFMRLAEAQVQEPDHDYPASAQPQDTVLEPQVTQEDPAARMEQKNASESMASRGAEERSALLQEEPNDDKVQAKAADAPTEIPGGQGSFRQQDTTAHAGADRSQPTVEAQSTQETDQLRTIRQDTRSPWMDQKSAALEPDGREEALADGDTDVGKVMTSDRTDALEPGTAEISGRTESAAAEAPQTVGREAVRAESQEEAVTQREDDLAERLEQLLRDRSEEDGQQEFSGQRQETETAGTHGRTAGSREQTEPVFAQLQQTQTGDIPQEAIPRETQSYTSVDTVDLIRQVVQNIRTATQNQLTSLEMQLNPEHLGKVLVHLTSREGAVSAQFTAANEVVRAALEAQIADLKENLNQAGVKVDAIEVAVGAHEFEQNLEQNARGEAEQAEQQEQQRRGRRSLSIDSLDELSGIMTEEERLAAQIMRDNGNSMDVIA